MACGCRNKERMSALCKVRELAKKNAVLDQTMVTIYKKADGSYNFTAFGSDYEGEMVEIVHYL